LALGKEAVYTIELMVADQKQAENSQIPQRFNYKCFHGSGSNIIL